MGLETVSIELDDPFGDDENDFDNLGMALVSTSSNWLFCGVVDAICFLRFQNQNTRFRLSPTSIVFVSRYDYIIILWYGLDCV